ncbi:hypothetical protein [Parabacteroides sp.]|nr:hypothetical protein [Parabacteroides sp.]
MNRFLACRGDEQSGPPDCCEGAPGVWERASARGFLVGLEKNG